MKKTTAVFQKPLPIPRQKTHEILSGLLVFILLPIINSLVAIAGTESALYNSLSRIAWPEGRLWVVYLWGILNVGCFFYVAELFLRVGGYTKKWRGGIRATETLSAIVLTGGVSIPAYVDRGEYYLLLQNVHTIICAIGFVGFFLTLAFVSATLFRRNTRQAMVSSMINAFILIVGVFGIFTVRDPASYCHISSIMQIIIFNLYNVSLLAHYYGMTLFPFEKEQRDEEKQVT